MRGGIPLRLLQGGSCTALAPADWQVTNLAPNNAGVDLSNGRMYAGWMIAGIDTVMASYYPQYANPEAYLHSLMLLGAQSLGDSTYRFLTNQEFAGATVRDVETERFRGVVLVRLFPGGTPTSFIMALRSATVGKGAWQVELPIAAAVALSIRCRVSLMPPTYGSGSRGGDEGDDLSTYNRQLGTEYAHSPRTGENFLMTHATDWLESGPEGPGYYRIVGNDHEKLVPGRSDR